MKISVYITSYNQKSYLVEAIESVLGQTLVPHQIIIVDDWSTDGSIEIIKAYCSRYPKLITPIFHGTNTGIAQVRIDALNAVTGDFVTYVDGDDRFLPEKLKKESNALKTEPHARIAFSNNYYLTQSGVRMGVWVTDKKPPQGNIFKETFARDFPKGILFRNELVEYRAWREIEFHNKDLNLYEDYDMRIRLTKRCRAVYYDEPLSEYRCHEGGLSKAAIIKHLEAFEYIYAANKPLLYDLNQEDRNYVNKRLQQKIIYFMGVVARESLFKGHYTNAGRYYLKLLKQKINMKKEL